MQFCKTFPVFNELLQTCSVCGIQMPGAVFNAVFLYPPHRLIQGFLPIPSGFHRPDPRMKQPGNLPLLLFIRKHTDNPRRIHFSVRMLLK